MPDPLHWFRRSAPPPVDEDDDVSGSLLGVPEAPPWLEDTEWHEDPPEPAVEPDE